MKLIFYTDGACSGNPGLGGYGVVALDSTGKVLSKYSSPAFKITTNNRMELMALRDALLDATSNMEDEITVYTDSKYASDAFNQGWIHGWKNRGFVNVKNPDLWKEIHSLYSKLTSFTIIHVKAHNGDEMNELADELAVAARESSEVISDTYYEEYC